jgi:hypothetical protein
LTNLVATPLRFADTNFGSSFQFPASKSSRIINRRLAHQNHRSKHPAGPARLNRSFLDPIAGIGMPFHASIFHPTNSQLHHVLPRSIIWR